MTIKTQSTFLFIFAILMTTVFIFALKSTLSTSMQEIRQEIQQGSSRLDIRTLKTSDNIIATYQKMVVTSYTADPRENGGYSTTAWGQKPIGRIAAIWTCMLRTFPKGSSVYVEGLGTYKIADTMGKCNVPNCRKHLNIDVLSADKRSAFQIGRSTKLIRKVD